MQVLVKLVVCRPCLYYMFAIKRNCLPQGFHIDCVWEVALNYS